MMSDSRVLVTLKLTAAESENGSYFLHVNRGIRNVSSTGMYILTSLFPLWMSVLKIC